MNDKDALENIIRKRDTQPRSKLALEKTSSTHQTEAFDTWLAMTQQELRELRKRCNELCMHNSDLVRELLNLRSTMSHLGYVSCDKLSFPDSGNAQMGHKSPLVDPCGRSSGNGTADCASLEELPEADQLLETEEGMPSASQQHMSESLCEANAEHTFTSTQLEQLMELSMHAQATGTRTTPSPINSERRASMRALPSAVLSSTSKSHDHSDCVEYANGETRGTEEMRSYAISDASYVESLTPQRPALRDTRDQKELSQVDPDWTRRPQILLVEDDRKCRKIGGVLLDALRCNVEFAQDGLQAVTKVSAGAMYDLVLMGTAMPHLDGVSATHYIRRFNHTPIIAMASSLDDGHLAMYSEHGRHSPKQVLVRITDLNCIRNERRITEAIHVGRSAEHAQKASWPSQEGYPVNLDM
jgi:osomolarity two-component system response regulator SKN7